MTLRIAKASVGPRTTISISGRIRSVDVPDIRDEMKRSTGKFVLDLNEVTLVDVGVVQFLSECEAEGVELVNCSAYIREWICRERETDESDS